MRTVLVTSSVPRLSPLTIRRPRLERWLRAYAQTPLRLLLAPSGFGKTSLLLTYATESTSEAAYCALPPDCDVATMRTEIVRALNGGKAPRTYEAFVDLISGSPAHCREIIVDDSDNASPEAIAELLALVDDARENVTLIYAARSRERLNAGRVTARGIAVACGARMLAFDAEETATLAQACGTQPTDLDVRRLVEETEGWAIPLCGAVRIAAADGLTLMQGYDRWRAQSSVFLHELLAAELQRVEARDRTLFWDLLNGNVSPEPQRMYELESRGLFIYDDGAGDVRLYRTLHQHGTRPKGDAPAERRAAPMMVRMFRDFDAMIDGRPVPWVRRRDQQIVKYLLLKPEGRATRSEIADVFWSGTDKHLATQSVRTACSTIRKAIASVVGHADVERYFRTSPDLHIDLANVVCDVRRFVTHLNDGDCAYGNGDMQSAGMHYRAAEKLYSGRLLEFEAAEPWFEAHARLLHERFVISLERVSEIALDRLDSQEARHYAMRARAAAPESPSAAALLLRVDAARRPMPAPAVVAPQPGRRAKSVYVESV